MHSRRDVLAMGIAAGALTLLAADAVAQTEGGPPQQAPNGPSYVRGATAITEVFGDGQRLTAVALGFEQEIDNARLSPSSFAVAGRTITRVYANSAAEPADHGSDGRFAIIELSPDDPDAKLYVAQGFSAVRKEAKATVTLTGPVVTTSGQTYPASAESIQTTVVSNLIVDEFQQSVFSNPGTGDALGYNLFVPRNYDPAKSYPLVLFMHDAGATNTVTDTTLVQGLGAVIWASPGDQARHEAFVLAPQYATQIVSDQSQATSMLDTTVALVEHIARMYNIDRNRLYTTGQSGGGMMSIAIDIKHPDLFAASFLVACQWDPTLVKPLANDRLWIVVSEGDAKAFPGQNAITATLEKEGAKVSRATWDGRSPPAQFAADVAQMEAQATPINYAVLQKGTVVPAGQPDDPGSNHINTWRIAYTVDGIRDWIFEQRKKG